MKTFIALTLAALATAGTAQAKMLDVNLDCAKDHNVVVHMAIGNIEQSSMELRGKTFTFVKAGKDESGQNAAMFKNDDLRMVAGYSYSQESFVKGSAMITTLDGSTESPVPQLCTITSGYVDGKRAF